MHVPECATKDGSNRLVFKIIRINITQTVPVGYAFQIELVCDGYVGEIGLQEIITSDIVCLTENGKGLALYLTMGAYRVV